MIRYAEAVFNGHPDKFCDILADHLIEEAYKADAEAYGQIEVSVWSDVVWLSGSIVTEKCYPKALSKSSRMSDIISATPENYIDAGKYKYRTKYVSR